MKNYLSGLALLFFIVIAFGSVDEAPKITAETTASVEITAAQLYQEYQANEIAADEKYKDQIIQVSGRIRDIGNDLMDNPYITLVGDPYFGDVQCYFSEKSIVASLSKGQQITVMGICDGLMMNVLLNDCVIK